MITLPRQYPPIGTATPDMRTEPPILSAQDERRSLIFGLRCWVLPFRLPSGSRRNHAVSRSRRAKHGLKPTAAENAASKPHDGDAQPEMATDPPAASANLHREISLVPPVNAGSGQRRSDQEPSDRLTTEGQIQLTRTIQSAARESKKHDSPILEICVSRPRYQRLFPSDRYESLALPTRARTRFEPCYPIPVQSEYCRTLICLAATQRCPDVLGLLSELNRIMRPDGVAYLTAPLTVEVVSPMGQAHRPRYGLNYLMESAGFRIEDLKAVADSGLYVVSATKKPCRVHTNPV